MFLLQIRPPHMELYLCAHAVILQCLLFFFCRGLAYAITANGVCLHLLVPPLAQYCFFGASCLTQLLVLLTNRWAYFQEKSTLASGKATTSVKKGGWAYFRGWPIFERLWYSCFSVVNLQQQKENQLV